MKSALSALVVATALLATGPANAQERTVRIEVNGLFCASCPYIAAQAITKIKSTKITGGFYDAGKQMAQFVVQYDDTVTTPEAIAAATGKYGYDGKVMKASAGNS